MVLLPKGTGGYLEIGPVEVSWKVFTNVVNCRLEGSVQLQDLLHGFRKGQVMGTAALEANM